MISTLPPEEIEQYYESVVLPKVPFGRQWDEMYDSPKVTPVHLEFYESISNQDNTYFTLSLLDTGLDITLDYRCH